MGRYLISTNDSQEQALVYAYQQAQALALPLATTRAVPPTQAQYFEQQIDFVVLAPMEAAYSTALHDSIIQSLSTIPEADRPAARAEITVVVEKYGGTVLPKP